MAVTTRRPAGELPRSPQVGDLVRLNGERRVAVTQACNAAGWPIDPFAAREVIRADPFNPGGGRRLFVDGPPFAFTPMQVELAWKDGPQCAERRKAIAAKGWRP